MDKALPFAVILFLGIAGFGLRAFFAGEPLWIDELHTAWTVDTTINEVAARAALGNQSPVFFWIQWLICRLAGLSEASLRSLSIAASSVGIFSAGYLVWHWTRSLTAVAVTVGLAATDTWLIFFGSEARPYALLQLVCVLQSFYLVQELGFAPFASDNAEVTTKNVNWLLVATTALLPLIHLTSLLLILSQVMFVALYRPANAKRILASLGASLFALLGNYPALLQVFTNRSDWSSVAGDPTVLLNDIAPSLLPCFVIPLLLLATFRIFVSDQGRFNNRLLYFLSFCIVGPIGCALLFSLASLAPVASIRYVSGSLIYLPLFAGCVLTYMEKSSYAITVVFLLASVIWVNPLAKNFLDGEPTQFRNENWHSVTSRLEQNPIGDQPLVFLFANLVEDHRLQTTQEDTAFYNYLMFPLSGIYALSDNSIIVPMPTLAARRWQSKQVRLIQENGGTQIVARTDDRTLMSIVDELNRMCQKQNLSLQIETESQADNIVKIVNVTIADSEAGQQP